MQSVGTLKPECFSAACAKTVKQLDTTQQRCPCARPGRTHCTNSAELWWPPESCRLPSTVVWMYLPPALPLMVRSQHHVQKPYCFMAFV